jgi:ATP phosphoribosyltransferase regulatory subunit
MPYTRRTMIPEGMHDVLPAEAAALRAIENALRERFLAYGYGEVRTPALEFADTLAAADDDVVAAAYRLFDAQGQVLALRTDMTVPTVRLAATRFRERRVPLRLWYVADSYRPLAPSRGQDGQFTQAGVELLGAADVGADAECVALLCDALASSGLVDFSVTIGTVAFHGALVQALGLPPDQAEAALAALADGDFPMLESIISGSAVSERAERALQRALRIGSGDAALAQVRRLGAGPAVEAAVERLVQVRELVDQAGFAEHVSIDLGLLPGLSYYSGLVVEAYAPGVGLPIASGGRYDGLPAALGWDVPGVGFAVAVHRLREALDEAASLPESERPLVFAGGLEEPALASELRAAGLPVMAVPAGEQPLRPPSLHREGGDWMLTLRGGAAVRGSWRDIRRALGAEP